MIAIHFCVFGCNVTAAPLSKRSLSLSCIDAEFANFSFYEILHLIAMECMQDDLPGEAFRSRSR